MLQNIISNKEISPYFYSFIRRIRLIFSLFLSCFFLFKFGYCKACQRAMKHKRLKAGSRIQRENKTCFGLGYHRRGGGGGSKSFTPSSRLLPNIYLLAHWETGWLMLIQQKSSLVSLVAHSCRFRPTSRRWRVRHEHSL